MLVNIGPEVKNNGPQPTWLDDLFLQGPPIAHFLIDVFNICHVVLHLLYMVNRNVVTQFKLIFNWSVI